MSASPKSLSGLSFDPENELLGHISAHRADNAISHVDRPLFTRQALDIIGEHILPQRALYGAVLAQRAPGLSEDVCPSMAKVYINSNAPFSGVICGVQGSGKSHSTAVLLEGCLISDQRIGTLPAPLTALVFHFDSAAGGGVVQPCEAAYLATLNSDRAGSAKSPDVTVLVIPNNLDQMRQVYASLPNVKVAPLHFAPEDISGDRLLAMMKVGSDSDAPLYIEVMMGILRSMQVFDYRIFRAKLDEKARFFAPNQKSMMNLRLSLLDSFLAGGNLSNRISSHFKSGQLTVIDLSSPFMDASAACSFFDIILGLFIEHRPMRNHGLPAKPPAKLVVLDEAHKYLTDNGTASRLTDSLLTIIRQQRHENMRVLISTQEPTVVPSQFLDLCSFILAHRFSSPRWLKHLAEHVSAAGSISEDWASKVVSLQTGEAMLFAPAGLAVKTGNVVEQPTVAPIGQGYLLVRSRLRITCDGGQSLLAVDAAEQGNSSHSRMSTSSTATLHSMDVSSSQTSSASVKACAQPATPAGTAPSATGISSSPPSTSGRLPPSVPTSTVTAAVATTSIRPSTLKPASVGGGGSTTRNANVRGAPAARAPAPLSKSQQKFAGMVAFLRTEQQRGCTRVLLSAIESHRAKNAGLYAQLPKESQHFVQSAKDLKVVTVGGKKSKQWLELALS